MTKRFTVPGAELDVRYTILEDAGILGVKAKVEWGKATPQGGFRTLRQKTMVFTSKKINELYAKRTK